MNILHYSLGLPPYRTGGLTKYAHDLMLEQARQGDKVYLLFPGQMKLFNKRIKVSLYKYYRGIPVYELINPQPVPLLKGIAYPGEFMKPADMDIFIEFLNKANIDIIHIHTLMGLYREFMEAVQALKIKIVYTSHDYFGLCPKVNFIDHNGTLCEKRDVDKCIKCNAEGSSLNKIRILQSKTYRYAKNKGLVTRVKGFLKGKINESSNVNPEECGCRTDKSEFIGLLNYYKSMFKYVDEFLFNSKVAEAMYGRYINAKGSVIPITHGDIKDNRAKKEYGDDILNLTYLGPARKYKGFFMLKDVMNNIQKDGCSNVILRMYGDSGQGGVDVSSNIETRGRYSYSDLKKIFDSTDLLIVPSICYETFGFVTLEALSHGVPIMITDRTGSMDLIDEDKLKRGIIIEASEESLYRELSNIIKNKSKLKEFNDNILHSTFKYQLNNHCRDIKNVYRRLTEKK